MLERFLREQIFSEREFFEYALKGLKCEREKQDHFYRQGLVYLNKHGITFSTTEEDKNVYLEKQSKVDELYQAIQALNKKIVELEWFIDTELG